MNGKNGSAVVKVLIFIAALGILGLALSHLAVSRLAVGRLRCERLQAQAAAESGLEEVLYRLQHDPDWYADGSDSRPLVVRELPDWRCELRVLPDADGISYRAEATGTVGGANQTMQRTIVITQPDRYALYALEKLVLYTSGAIHGMVYAGKEMTGALPNGARLDTYPATMHRTELPKLADYLARRPDRILEGYLRNYRVENRFLFKAGTLTLDEGVLNNICWVADGTITVQGRTRATARQGLPLLFANGDILLNLAPGSELIGAIICRGTCTVTGSGKIRGPIIANNIDFGGSVSLAANPTRAEVFNAKMWWIY